MNSRGKAENIDVSIKKFFIDHIETPEGILLSFDPAFVDPDLWDYSVTEWIVIDINDAMLKPLCSGTVSVICATRQDDEQVRLAQIAGMVCGCIMETDGSYINIPMYEAGFPPVAIPESYLVVSRLGLSGKMDSRDGTNYRIVSFAVKWVL